MEGRSIGKDAEKLSAGREQRPVTMEWMITCRSSIVDAAAMLSGSAHNIVRRIGGRNSHSGSHRVHCD